ncbi:MAG: M6 family metalloprotease domain-containing protein [Calditrichaeota bacterium]|nr:MAG: M6 family metalloprotease domain-containing protein [Calditrichota bacterium]
MKIKYLLIAVLFIALPMTLSADVPLPGIEMPDNIRNLLAKMEQSSSAGNVARIIQQRKSDLKAGQLNTGHSVQSASSMAVPLLIGTYSNSAHFYSAVQFQNQIFDDNPSGTMVDYYDEISYGQFQLMGQTYGWYSAPQSQAFYVDSQSGLTGGGARFALDLVKASDAAIDFSQFDSDNDGYVDILMIVHTGPGAETQPSSVRDNIWSHRWNFSSARYYYPAIMPQGVYTTNDPRPGYPGQYIKINDYIIQPELKSHYNNGLIDIGVFCHEFGHALGLPDLYDTDYSSAGIGNWCLMASGSYGGDGGHPQTPAHMSAWCKEELGWISPTIVTEDMFAVEIPNIEEHFGAVYKIWKDGNPASEYFLIENRQKVGFDANIYNPGLLIWHIDKNIISAKSSSNKVNSDENHKGVDLEAADGSNDLDHNYNRGDGGDIFPGNANNASFTTTTNPNSTDYTNAPTYVEIANISLSGEMVIADLKIGVDGQDTDGQMTVYNDGFESLVVNNILADKNWLNASPSSFTIPPGSSKIVDITIDWSMVSRQEVAALSFSSNDASQPLLNATITAVPTDGASGDYILTVSVDTVEISPTGEMAAFEVTNAGTGLMDWNTVADNSWLEIAQGHGGQNMGTVQVTASENRDEETRVGSVTVSIDENPAEFQKVTFIQAGSEGTCASTWESTLLMQAGTTTTSLKFGQGQNTTSGLDDECGENELPPVPPSEIFDARFQIEGTQGSLADFRSDSEEEPVWVLHLQPGINTNSIAFSWNKAALPEGSFTLIDGYGGAITNTDMKKVSSYILTNTNVTTLFIKFTAEITESVTILSGWNLISVPLAANDMSVATLFPNSGTSTAYSYENGFVSKNILESGKGYWLKSSASKNYTVQGYELESQNIPVKAGWNLIGPLASDVVISSISSSPLDNIESDFFGFDKGYFAATILKSGKGYWVRVKQDGLLIFSSSTGKTRVITTSSAKDSWPYILVSDAAGHSRELYFASNSEVAASSELPPLPPQGIADMRFSNNKDVVSLTGDNAVLKLHALTYPVKIELIANDLAVKVDNPFSEEMNTEISGKNPVMILDEAVESLVLSSAKTSELPEAFILSQNYPNPFNPETRFEFSLPQKMQVKLTIYNLIGQQLAVLINQELAAGQHSIVFNARNLSSGVYFYTLQTKENLAIKKMILSK